MNPNLSSYLYPAMCALLVVTIGYNVLVMINSEEGLHMRNALHNEIVQQQNEINKLEKEYVALSDRAQRLIAADLDSDLLEERVRGVLGLVRPDEYLVRMEDLDRLAMSNSGLEQEKEMETVRPAARYAGLEALLISEARRLEDLRTAG